MVSPELQGSHQRSDDQLPVGLRDVLSGKVRKARAGYLVNMIADRTLKLREQAKDRPLELENRSATGTKLGVVSVYEVDDHGLTVDYEDFTGGEGFKVALQSETGDSYGLVSLAMGSEDDGWVVYDPRRVGEMALLDQGRLLKPIIRSLEAVRE